MEGRSEVRQAETADLVGSVRLFGSGELFGYYGTYKDLEAGRNDLVRSVYTWTGAINNRPLDAILPTLQRSRNQLPSKLGWTG